MTGASAPADSPPHPRRLFWQRDFRSIWIGETTSRLGTSITSVAVPLVAVLTLNASTFGVAVLTGALWLPWLIIGLPAGAWVDRLPRRPLMLICDVVSLAILLSVPIAAWTARLTYEQLLTVMLLIGVCSVFFQTAYQVYLPALVKPEQLADANAKLQGSESAAQVVGPGLAGLIAQVAGAVMGLVADAASFLVSAFFLLRVKVREDPHEPRTARTTTLRREIAEGIRFVMADPYLRGFTLFGAVSNIALTGYQSILVVFLIREIGVSPGAVGLVISMMSLGGVVGAMAAGFIGRHFGTARGILLIELGTAPFGLLIPFAVAGPRIWLATVGGFVVVVGIVSGNVIKAGWRQVYCPRSLLGRVITGMQFLNYGGIPLGALLAGVLGSTIGVRAAMWITLAGLTLAPLILLIGPIRCNRELPTLSWSPSGRSDNQEGAIEATAEVSS